MMNLHTGIPFEGRGRNVVVITDADNRRIRIEATQNWIVNDAGHERNSFVIHTAFSQVNCRLSARRGATPDLPGPRSKESPRQSDRTPPDKRKTARSQSN